MSKYSTMVKRLRKNYTYDTKQLRADFSVHPQTVRQWVKDPKHPLSVIQQRPILVFSENLRAYLAAKEKARKFTLTAIQFSCMSCKQPRTPLQNKAYFNEHGSRVYLHALCAACHTPMCKVQSRAKLALLAPCFERITLEDLHILGRTNSNEKAHLGKNSTSHPSEPASDTHLMKQKKLL